MNLSCVFGSPGRFRPERPRLAPPLRPRPGLAEGRDLLTTPLLGDDAILAVDRRQGLLCLEVGSGEVRWRHGAERGWGECLLAGEVVVVTPAPDRIEELDLTTGAVVRTARVETGYVLRSSVVLGDRVLGPLVDGRLAAWDRNGEVLTWTGPAVRGDLPVAAADGLLVGVADGVLIGLEVDDGAERWRLPLTELGRREVFGDLEDGTVVGRVLVHDGRLWCAVTGGGVLCADLRDGTVLWHDKHWRIGVGLELVPPDELVVLADDVLLTLDAQTGAVRRRVPVRASTPLQAPFGPPALSVSHAWMVDRRGQLVAARLADGVVEQSMPVGGAVFEQPALDDNGLYVVTFDGRLAAFEH
jgi:outer membrane protein assembly factor BamB